jgi:EAL domain-containing protein (putative c-di-GMP-specific phosphodiesterase class I)
VEQLPIARVKLDRILAKGVDSNLRSAAVAIVRSIVALCHGLGLQVIAEGVERPAQLEFLSHCGLIGMQGYLLAYRVETHDAIIGRSRLRGRGVSSAAGGESNIVLQL